MHECHCVHVKVFPRRILRLAAPYDTASCVKAATTWRRAGPYGAGSGLNESYIGYILAIVPVHPPVSQRSRHCSVCETDVSLVSTMEISNVFTTRYSMGPFSA